MIAPSSRRVLAVDGGGTRCRLALAEGAARVCVEGGPVNVSSDFQAALAALRDALGRLAAAAGLTPAELGRIPAFIGLAGVTGPALAEAAQAALGFAAARVADDRPAALRGALGLAEGVLAHCGTGSFVAARIDGRTRFAGGWGARLGDEASAQWLGRRALGLALRAADGRAAPSALSERIGREIGAPAEIVGFAAGATPAEFGRFAPLVADLAGEGDALAAAAMREGAAEIARSASALGWGEGRVLSLAGGLGPRFAPFLPAPMRAALAPPEAEPLEGAVALAREFAAEIAGAEIAGAEGRGA